jgi:hypothetical protein
MEQKQRKRFLDIIYYRAHFLLPDSLLTNNANKNAEIAGNTQKIPGSAVFSEHTELFLLLF